jgi:serine/threonine protein kinase
MDSSKEVEIITKLGEGAYGKVFRAINKNDNKEYAVKVIEVRRFK